MLQSTGIVRRIIEDGDKFLVSFPNHAGYFHADKQNLRDRLRQAQKENLVISFIYDPTLKILSLQVSGADQGGSGRSIGTPAGVDPVSSPRRT